MSYLFYNLETHIKTMLFIALFLVFVYEAINGFHDTANSVVTVIYTHALKSHNAVIMSGIFNFLGVMLSGLSVAYTIIHLLPTYFFINANTNHTFAMIFSLLLAATLWNLGTWYFGLPTSSSHTLIGALIGIGLTHSIITENSITHELNISQLIKIFLSLIISPIIGLILSKIIILIICKIIWRKNKKFNKIHITPTENKKKYGTIHPSLWTRIVLIISAAGVSFFHGANDGQKGIGLIMLLLIGVAPAAFMLNMQATQQEISNTKNSLHKFQEYYIRNYNNFPTLLLPKIMNISELIQLYSLHVDTTYSDNIFNAIKKEKHYFIYKNINPKYLLTDQEKKFHYNLPLVIIILKNASFLLDKLDNYEQLNITERSEIRKLLIYIVDIMDQIISFPETSYKNKNFIKNLKYQILHATEYAPTWIVLAVALSLSLGTVIGWKRVTITIGEKIGKKEMTYAQGISAQLTTAISIGTASYIGMPVSTTHVLSSAVTGCMLIQGWGVQMKIIKNILITWILTLPISILLSSSFYWLTLTILHQYIKI